MIKLKMSKNKLLLNKCLLAVYLFFSFITIAGYSTYPYKICRQTGQTELVYVGKSPAANKTLLYRRRLISKNQIAFHSHDSNLISILIYNRIVEVKLNSYLKKVYSISIPNRLLPINSTLQNSDEDHFTFFPS